jgi:hypothetical protein
MSRSVRVRLDPDLYPPSAVAHAVAAFADHAAIRRDAAAPDMVVIAVTGDNDRVADEFLNYALMASLELHLARK